MQEREVEIHIPEPVVEISHGVEEDSLDVEDLVLVLDLTRQPEFAVGTYGFKFLADNGREISKLIKIADDNGHDDEDSFFLGNEMVITKSHLDSAVAMGAKVAMARSSKNFSKRAFQISQSVGTIRFLTREDQVLQEREEYQLYDGIRQIDFNDYEEFRRNFTLSDVLNYFFDELEDEDSVELRSEVFDLSFLHPEDLEKNLWRESGIRKTATKDGMHYIASLRRLRSAMHDSLFSSESEEDLDMQKNFLNLFTSLAVEDKYIVLSYFSDKSSMSSLYKDAYFAKQSGENSFLYDAIMQGVKISLEEGEDPENLLFLEDLHDISLTGQIEKLPEEQTSQLDTLQQIISHTSTKEFEIFPEDVDWNGIVSPTKIKLNLNSDKQHEYGFSLEYENDMGEQMTLKINFDKDGQLSWNVLEMPQEAPEIAKNIGVLGKKLLQNVLDRVKIVYLEKKAVKSVSFPEKRQIRTQRHIHSSHRPHHQKKSTDGKHENSSISYRHEIKQQIFIPDHEEFEKMLMQFSSDEKERIVGVIQGINESGKGRFKKLQTPKTENYSLFRLRVGDNRVLLRNIEGENGVQHFEIVDVSPRDTVYRNVI